MFQALVLKLISICKICPYHQLHWSIGNQHYFETSRFHISGTSPTSPSVVRLQDVINESRDSISKVRNNDVPLVPLHDVSN